MIEKILVLSTGHLSKETAEKFNSNSGSAHWPDNLGVPIPYGYLVPAEIQDFEGEVAPEVKACAEYARERGASLIRFDCDGSTVEGLKTFEW